MVKKKHIMTFTRPVAIRKIGEIPTLLEREGAMTKHQLAKRLGVVSRTAQTYLAELKRRGKIHVASYSARTNGGTLVAVWTYGPEPDGFVAPVTRLPEDLTREDAKARRARRRAEAAARQRKEKKAGPQFDPFGDPLHIAIWNIVNYPRKLCK